MILSARQKKTLKDLKKYRNITEPKDIIKFCIDKLDKPNRHSSNPLSERRKHSKKYYQEIIEYLSQQPAK